MRRFESKTARLRRRVNELEAACRLNEARIAAFRDENEVLVRTLANFSGRMLVIRAALDERYEVFPPVTPDEIREQVAAAFEDSEVDEGHEADYLAPLHDADDCPHCPPTEKVTSWRAT